AARRPHQRGDQLRPRGSARIPGRDGPPGPVVRGKAHRRHPLRPPARPGGVSVPLRAGRGGVAARRGGARDRARPGRHARARPDGARLLPDDAGGRASGPQRQRRGGPRPHVVRDPGDVLHRLSRQRQGRRLRPGDAPPVQAQRRGRLLRRGDERPAV
ncbi:MAG: hypothetical protein AVDCRST_MAG85-2264, partial [uncultured Solirubrobacteraceae bacterium]